MTVRRSPLVASGAASLAAAVLLAACWPDSSGIDPPTAAAGPDSVRFFFPTGMALTASGRYLLVGNSNFDLRYNAGTVVVVDLARVDAALAGCGGRCREPRDETPFLVPEATVVIGSQITDLALAPDGRRAYAAVRGNASLTWLEVAEDADPAAARILRCADDNRPGAQRCDALHQVVRTGELWVPAEPYAVLADDDWVFLGHVDSGRVAVFDVAAGPVPELVRVLDSFPTGVNHLAKQPGTDWYWLASRDSSRLYPFTITMAARAAGEGPAVAVGRTIDLVANSPGSDTRAIAFSPAGDRAFATNREPPSVVVVDISLRPDGAVDGTVLGTIGIGSGPSRIAAQPLPDGSYVVLAVCFDAEEVFVIDPELRAVVDVFRTGVGPHAIVPHAAARRAYLANFGESSVWVLDFDPASPYYARPVFQLGLPEIPSSHD